MKKVTESTACLAIAMIASLTAYVVHLGHDGGIIYLAISLLGGIAGVQAARRPKALPPT